MTVERSRVEWGFWLWWVLASTLGWFLGFFVGFVGGYFLLRRSSASLTAS